MEALTCGISIGLPNHPESSDQLDGNKAFGRLWERNRGVFKFVRKRERDVSSSTCKKEYGDAKRKKRNPLKKPRSLFEGTEEKNKKN